MPVYGANKAEAYAAWWMEERGFTVTRRGWPDFIATRGEKVWVVEVKPHADMPLKVPQENVMRYLDGLGATCLRFDPEGEFRRWDAVPRNPQ